MNYEKRVEAIMKTTRVIIAAFSLALCVKAVTAQEKKAEPEHKMVEFHMALLKLGPKGAAIDTPDAKKTHKAQKAYFEELVKAGKVVLGGPVADAGDLKGVYVFRAKTSDEARSWADADPSVMAGYLNVEMIPWWSEEVMKPAAIPLNFKPAYLAFLVRGAKWTPERTPQTEEVQKAHLANIVRLAETKKLVVAGPFGGDGKNRLRGIFVFKVASLQEAKALADTDPAVQAGRLALEIYPWFVPDGMLP
jgi:uncharacterized protein YciI